MTGIPIMPCNMQTPVAISSQRSDFDEAHWRFCINRANEVWQRMYQACTNQDYLGYQVFKQDDLEIITVLIRRKA